MKITSNFSAQPKNKITEAICVFWWISGKIKSLSDFDCYFFEIFPMVRIGLSVEKECQRKKWKVTGKMSNRARFLALLIL
jgi:hypothetical protein